MASLFWTAACFVIGGVSLSYFVNHPVPGVAENVVAERLGNGVGACCTLGYAALWLPYSFQVGQKRRAERARRG